jgi:hypothetical protein
MHKIDFQEVVSEWAPSRVRTGALESENSLLGSHVRTCNTPVRTAMAECELYGLKPAGPNSHLPRPNSTHDKGLMGDKILPLLHFSQKQPTSKHSDFISY